MLSDLTVPHLRLHVPDVWLGDDFRRATGFDTRVLLDHLAGVVASFHMPNPVKAGGDDPSAPDTVPMINLHNLKHAIGLPRQDTRRRSVEGG